MASRCALGGFADAPGSGLSPANGLGRRGSCELGGNCRADPGCTTGRGALLVAMGSSRVNRLAIGWRSLTRSDLDAPSARWFVGFSGKRGGGAPFAGFSGAHACWAELFRCGALARELAGPPLVAPPVRSVSPLSGLRNSFAGFPRVPLAVFRVLATRSPAAPPVAKFCRAFRALALRRTGWVSGGGGSWHWRRGVGVNPSLTRGVRIGVGVGFGRDAGCTTGRGALPWRSCPAG